MAKVKKQPFEVGETVWLEEMSWRRTEDDHRTVTEYKIVEVNKTSAYAVRMDRIKEYEEGQRFSKVRIDQRSHAAKNSVCRYSVWHSKESFEQAITDGAELKRLRKQAAMRIAKMNAQELKRVIDL